MGQPPPDLSATSPIRADDFALMAGVRARDSEAMGTLYDRYSAAVYGLCLRVLNDRRDAEDLLIDVFAEIWERGDRFDPTRGSPVGHIMGLARSRAIDRLRSRRSAARIGADGAMNVEAANQLSNDDSGPLDAAIDAEQSRRIIQALRTLASDQRQALELAYFEALSHSEIAERLGEPLGTIKSRIRQAMIHLREVMGGGGG